MAIPIIIKYCYSVWFSLVHMLYMYLCCVCVDSLSITDMTGEPIPLDRDDISWQSDRDTRFQNTDGHITRQEEDNVQPKNWQRNISEIPNSLQNEDLIVWFRVSAFPNFIKLYARIHGGTLPAGDYTLNVEYSILNILEDLFLLYLSMHILCIVI